MIEHDPETVARLMKTVADYEAGKIKAIPSSATSCAFGMSLMMQARRDRNLGQVYKETIAANNPGVDVEAAMDALCDDRAWPNDDGTLAYAHPLFLKVVTLKDGRTGTILDTDSRRHCYELEVDGSNDTVTIYEREIVDCRYGE